MYRQLALIAASCLSLVSCNGIPQFRGAVGAAEITQGVPIMMAMEKRAPTCRIAGETLCPDQDGCCEAGAACAYTTTGGQVYGICKADCLVGVATCTTPIRACCQHYGEYCGNDGTCTPIGTVGTSTGFVPATTSSYYSPAATTTTYTPIYTTATPPTGGSAVGLDSSSRVLTSSTGTLFGGDESSTTTTRSTTTRHSTSSTTTSSTSTSTGGANAMKIGEWMLLPFLGAAMGL